MGSMRDRRAERSGAHTAGCVVYQSMLASWLVCYVYWLVACRRWQLVQPLASMATLHLAAVAPYKGVMAGPIVHDPPATFTYCVVAAVPDVAQYHINSIRCRIGTSSLSGPVVHRLVTIYKHTYIEPDDVPDRHVLIPYRSTPRWVVARKSSALYCW
jgi:hypothetical protein